MAKVRVEFVTLGAGVSYDGAAMGQIKQFFGAVDVVTSTSATAAGSRPVAPLFTDSNGKLGIALVTARDGDVIVAWGEDPTVTQANGMLVPLGQSIMLPVQTGHKLSFINAT